MNVRFFAVLILLLLHASTMRAGDAPYGIDARVPWATPRVSGSPEPPSPYVTERIFPKIRFDRPVDLVFAPDNKRIFVAQEKSKIYSFKNDPNADHTDLFFDPTAELKSWQNVPKCKGVDTTYALCFHPQFEQNHFCYIEYNLAYTFRARNHPNGSRISRFVVTETDPPRIVPGSETILIEWLSGGHNGCTLHFGPDGYLYASTGDAADPDPPDDLNTGQDISDLLSSVLRIDVDHEANGKPYAIPKDNPFIKTEGARPEVWAFGFRNPWRMNFDSKTGNLWVGDVGWELYENVHCVKSGGNYGWSIMEGPNPVHPDGKRGPGEIIKPQAALSHAEAASITGGIVYRGKKLPELYGCYVFGDWQTSRIWSAKCTGKNDDALEPYREIAQTEHRIVCFTEDSDREPIILDHLGGGMFRLVRNPALGQPSNFPRKLSETGLFSNVKEQTPAPGVLPFAINTPQWLDGATGERWVATPGATKMTWGRGVWGDAKPAWPKDSVIAKTLWLEMKTGDASSKKKIETQLLHFDGLQWRGYSYAWNDEQTDAELVPSGGDDRSLVIADPAAATGTRRQTWHFPSRTQCNTCHSVWSDYALAFNDPQLDRVEKFKSGDGKIVEDNQIRTFRHLGLLLEPLPPEKPKPGDPPPPPPEKMALCDPYNPANDLYERARSYLHVNCSHCHRFGGGGTALIDVRKEMHPKDLKAINEKPVLGDFGIEGGKLICAGDPNRSVLLFRASKMGRGRMPHIGSDLVDEKGMVLLREWIASLPAEKSDDAVAKVRDSQKQDLQALENASVAADARDAAVERLLGCTSGALTLLNDVQSGKLAAPVRQAALAKAFVAKLETARDLFRRFDPREQTANRLGQNFNREKLLAIKGDAARGKKVFFETGATAPSANDAGANNGLCLKCHRLENKGVAFGPDLAQIGKKYNRAQLLENIVEPSKTIAEGFTNYLLRAKDGTVYSGLLVRKTDAEVVLKDQQKEYHIPTSDVQKMAPQLLSAMPEGLLSDLSPQEAADLIEYLSTLK